MRYHPSVHDIHKTHIDKLDALARKYLNKWLNIPSHGATDISIYHPYLLNVKTPSQLYMEGHAGNYALMRIKGDATVQLTLDSRLAREALWTTKSSTIVACDEALTDNIANDKCFIPTQDNTLDIENSRRIEIPKSKKAMKETIQEQTLKLTMQ